MCPHHLVDAIGAGQLDVSPVLSEDIWPLKSDISPRCANGFLSSLGGCSLDPMFSCFSIAADSWLQAMEKSSTCPSMCIFLTFAHGVACGPVMGCGLEVEGF